jgi:Ser/Thr protein kinase RdoA (MazF antagonist)
MTSTHQGPWGGATQFFYALTPHLLDQVLKEHGYRPAGRQLALNSLENRVWDLEVAKNVHLPHPDLDPLVVADNAVVIKFYRPGRWNQETIEEEHAFLRELLEYEIPVAPPLEIDGKTFFQEATTGLWYTLFPKIRGRLKDEYTAEELSVLGRLMSRVHRIGKLKHFQHRRHFSLETWVQPALSELIQWTHFPTHLRDSTKSAIEQFSDYATPLMNSLKKQRIHGDFHRGNILWTSSGPTLMDLDDTVMGPIEQDLWLLISGRDEWSVEQRDIFLKSYEEFSDDPVSLSPFMIEIFRTMRMLHFQIWITKRWEDPIFPHTFARCAEPLYWEQFLLDLKEQVGLIREISG